MDARAKAREHSVRNQITKMKLKLRKMRGVDKYMLVDENDIVVMGQNYNSTLDEICQYVNTRICNDKQALLARMSKAITEANEKRKTVLLYEEAKFTPYPGITSKDIRIAAEARAEGIKLAMFLAQPVIQRFPPRSPLRTTPPEISQEQDDKTWAEMFEELGTDLL